MIDTTSFGEGGSMLSTCTTRQSKYSNEDLIQWLMNSSNTYIFGGLVKHIINPNLDYGDIDLITVDIQLLDRLREKFGFVFIDVSRPSTPLRYFLAKSPHLPKTIQLLLMKSFAEAVTFTFNAQFDIDRVMYGDGRFHYDLSVGGEYVIKDAINAKRATLVRGPRNMAFFTENRRQIERRHYARLRQKGYSIIE